MKKITLLFFLFMTIWQSNAQTVVIGTGTVSTTSTGSDPVSGYYEAFRYQVIYKASELAPTMTPNDAITALGFSIDGDYGGGNLLGYTIKIGHTSATTLAAHNTSPTTTVKNAFSYNPTVTAAGVFDMITFDTPFVWNGIDNILVDICSDGPNPYTSPYGSVRATSIPTSARIYQVDSATACGNTTTSTLTNRPNIQFNYIDGVAPTCSAPILLNGTSITTSSATINWTAPTTAPANGYQYYVDTTGTPPTATTVATGTTAAGIVTTNLTGLLPNTTYNVSVRSACSATETSSWTSAYTFTTPCVAVNAFSENFDAVTTPSLPSCWAKILRGTTLSTFASVTTSVTTTNSAPNSVALYNSGSSLTDDIILVSPELSNLNSGTYRLKFFAKTAGSIQVGTLNNNSATAVFTPLQTVTTTATSTQYIVNFSAYTGTDKYIGFRETSGTYTTIYLDDIAWEPTPITPPACATAFVSTPNATCGNFATSLAWTAAAGADGYKITIGTTSGGTQILNDIAIGNVITYSFSGNANTTYYYKVVPFNANGSATGCSENTFATFATPCYCTPTYTTGKTSNDLISKIEIVGTTLLNDSGVAATNPAYTYFTGQPNYTGTMQAGSSYNVTVTVGTFGSQNVAVWIDYNDNATFEATERVGFSAAPIAGNGSATFPISLACNPPVGTHRMRVRDVYSTAANLIDPCANYTYGETEDYDVVITAAAACPQPKTLGANTITAFGANLTWITGCVETAWDVHVDAAGTGAPTGTPSNTGATSPLAVSGLFENTSYEFWVRANCGPNGFSTWTGPFTFNTTNLPPDCVALDAPVNAATDVATLGGIALTWLPAGSGSVASTYKVYVGTTNPPTTLVATLNTTGTPPTLATTYNYTGAAYSTTYFWSVVPSNNGGSATACVVNSFTTSAPPPPPINDDCSGASMLTVGANYAASPIVASIVGSTASEVATPNIPAPGCASYVGGDVWFAAVVPAAGTITFETAGVTGSFTDSGMAVYSGTCGALTLVGCDDDSAAGTSAFSLYAASGLTPGSTVYARVWRYGSASPIANNPGNPTTRNVSAAGDFSIAAYNAPLSTNSFDSNGFSAYPNPVTNILNLSYTQDISKVSVHNLIGQEVYSKTINATQSQLDLSNLSAGTYLVKVEVGSLVKTIKIVKQ